MSFFRVHREEEERSGGKILKGRHGVRATSPYQRPDLTPRSSPETKKSNWFFSLISPPALLIANGASKLLSSVFSSNNSASETESDSSSEDDDDDETSAKDVEELMQDGIAPEANKSHVNGPEPVAQRSEAKLAIEQLLLQETFSREECINLIKMLQSRVVGCPVQKGGEDATRRGVAFPEAWTSLGQGSKSPLVSHRWDSSLISVAPGDSAVRTPRNDICNAAVVEAKKWVEEKRLESSPSSGRGHVNCTLNTFMPPYVPEGTDCSPVDMAKSYMQARPPWTSPSLGNCGFRTPPPIRTHLYSDEGPYAISTPTLPSSKVLKRSYLAAGSWNSVDENRRVRLKSTEDVLEPPMFNQVDSSAKTLEHGIGQASSATDRREEVVSVGHESSPLQAEKPIDELVNLPAELAIKKDSPDDAFHLCDVKSIGGNLPVTGVLGTEKQDKVSSRILSEPEQTLNAQNLRSEATSSAVLLYKTMPSGLGDGTLANSTLAIQQKNQDFEVALLVEGHRVGCDSSSHDSLIPASAPLQHNGNLSVEVLNDERRAMTSSEVKCVISSDAVEVTLTNDALISSLETNSEVEKVIANNSAQPRQLPGLKEAHSVTDSRRQNRCNQSQPSNYFERYLPLIDQSFADSIRQSRSNQLQPTNGVVANGHTSSPSSTAGLNVCPGQRPSSERTQNLIGSSNGAVGVGKPVEACELLSEAFIKVPIADVADSEEVGSENNVSSKDGMPRTQVQTNSSHDVVERSVRAEKRAKKQGAYRRGRGRGRGK